MHNVVRSSRLVYAVFSLQGLAPGHYCGGFVSLFMFRFKSSSRQVLGVNANANGL